VGRTASGVQTTKWPNKHRDSTWGSESARG